MAISATLLTGCVTTLVGGSMESSIEVTVDPNTFSPIVRSTLQKAKNLGVVSMDRASIKAADLFETKGGYIVKIDRQAAKAGEMTGSERRDTLTNLCKSQRVDVALLGRIVKTESSGTASAVFSGRVKVDQNWIMDMLDCKSTSFNTFGGTLKMDLGIYSQKSQAEWEELIGAEIGTKILTAIGPRDSGNGSVRAEVAVPAPAQASLTSSGQNPGVKTVTDSNPMTVVELQKHLATLGFQVGAADGVMGKRTADALKNFQIDNGLAVSGRIDVETSAKIRQKVQQ